MKNQVQERDLIFIASSWRQRKRVRKLAEQLRKIGFDVYDFTDPSCRETEEIPPEKFPEQFNPERHNYWEYLNQPEWRSAVEENPKGEYIQNQYSPFLFILLYNSSNFVPSNNASNF